MFPAVAVCGGLVKTLGVRGDLVKSFSKKLIFPIIGEIIDKELLESEGINRDEIIKKLLVQSESRLMVEDAVKSYKTDDLLKVAGNMVDWFSAEISKKSDIALPWVNKYVRVKVKVNGRKVWQYQLGEEIYPDEVNVLEDENIYPEGALKKVVVNSYERNQKARTKCIQIYGARCSCCDFDFEKKYGDIGVGFIHVHHINPVSGISEEYKVDPERDLRPVCPNCHAMIHRRNPPYKVEEIREIFDKTPNKSN